MTVWRQQDEQSYNIAGRAPAYLSPAQAARYERVRQARLLYDGRHREYYLNEGRTLFDFPEMEINGAVKRPYVAFNVLGLISNKNGDLLFGQEPLIAAADENDVQGEAITELIRRSRLHPMLLGAAVTASAEGECFLRAVEYRDEVYVTEENSIGMYPVGPVMPDGQHAAYQKFEFDESGKLLLVSTFTAGAIERKLYRITETRGEGGGTVTAMNEVDVNSWPAKSRVWAPRVETGIASNLITWIPNLMLDGECVSDYDGALDFQDRLNAANTQIARILGKHADPFMAFPPESFDSNGNIRVAQKAVAKGSTPGSAPEYITWEGNLDAAMKDRDFALNGILIRTEMSAVLLGLKVGAAPEAYKKMRLEAFNSLSKAQRKSLYFTAGIARAIETACLLENAIDSKSFPAGYPVGPVSVTLRDGIPIDESDQATMIATLSIAGVMSDERAVGLQIPDAIAAEEELERIKAKRAAQTPSIFTQVEPGAMHEDTMPGGDGDEDLAPVVNQVGESGGPLAGTQDVKVTQDAVLNGAQVTAATAIVTAVAAGEIPLDAGLGQLEIFYNLKPDQAKKVMGSAGTSKPTTPNPKPNQGNELQASAPASNGGGST